MNVFLMQIFFDPFLSSHFLQARISFWLFKRTNSDSLEESQSYNTFSILTWGRLTIFISLTLVNTQLWTDCLRILPLLISCFSTFELLSQCSLDPLSPFFELDGKRNSLSKKPTIGVLRVTLVTCEKEEFHGHVFKRSEIVIKSDRSSLKS